MRAIPECAQAQHGAFTRRQALAAGWTDSALDHAVRRQRLMRPYHGVYAEAERMDAATPGERDSRFALVSAAAALALPAGAASHMSAAVLAGLPVLSVPERACVTVAPRYTGDAHGAHLHRAEFRRDGHLCDSWPRRTSVARTVADVARERGLAAGLVAADAALHRRLLSGAELRDVIADCAKWPGIRRARAVAALADELSESPLESVSRLEISRLDLPMPTLQAEIYDLDGRFLGRSDFLWEEAGLVGEADGAGKYAGDSLEPLYRQKTRQDGFEDVGLQVTRWGWPEVRQPTALAQRLCSAYARAVTRAAREGVTDRRWIVVRPAG
jgi:hypothetical protein